MHSDNSFTRYRDIFLFDSLRGPTLVSLLLYIFKNVNDGQIRGVYDTTNKIPECTHDNFHFLGQAILLYLTNSSIKKEISEQNIYSFLFAISE